MIVSNRFDFESDYNDDIPGTRFLGVPGENALIDLHEAIPTLPRQYHFEDGIGQVDQFGYPERRNSVIPQPGNSTLIIPSPNLITPPPFTVPSLPPIIIIQPAFPI